MCKPVIEYRDNNVTVKVPQKCSIPDVNCSLDGSDTEVVAKMYACIVDFEEAVKVCK